MRISDWSSDVCSSDLAPGGGMQKTGGAGFELRPPARARRSQWIMARHGLDRLPARRGPGQPARAASGSAAWRERKSVVVGKSVSVGVDPGGRRLLKKKKNQYYAITAPTQEKNK